MIDDEDGEEEKTPFEVVSDILDLGLRVEAGQEQADEMLAYMKSTEDEARDVVADKDCPFCGKTGLTIFFDASDVLAVCKSCGKSCPVTWREGYEIEEELEGDLEWKGHCVRSDVMSEFLESS